MACSVCKYFGKLGIGHNARTCSFRWKLPPVVQLELPAPVPELAVLQFPSASEVLELVQEDGVPELVEVPEPIKEPEETTLERELRAALKSAQGQTDLDQAQINTLNVILEQERAETRQLQSDLDSLLVAPPPAPVYVNVDPPTPSFSWKTPGGSTVSLFEATEDKLEDILLFMQRQIYPESTETINFVLKDEGKLRARLTALGYKTHMLCNQWYTFRIARAQEFWVGNGQRRNEAIEDAMQKMLPSVAAREAFEHLLSLKA